MRKPKKVIRNIRIVSMTTTFSMNGPVDLERVAICDRFFEYEPSLYPGVIFIKKEPRIGFTIFSSGKVVSTGGKNLGEVRIAMNEMFGRLRGAGFVFESLPEPKIRNLVAVADFGRKINIESLTSCLAGAIYKPEQFPALIYRTGQGKLVVLLFSSGKAILTGARTHADLNFAYDTVKRTLNELPVEKVTGLEHAGHDRKSSRKSNCNLARAASTSGYRLITQVMGRLIEQCY